MDQVPIDGFLLAVRAHPEYQRMLANLTETQARCTELLTEVRALRAKTADVPSPNKSDRFADRTAPLDGPPATRVRLPSNAPTPLVAGATVRCGECGMAPPFHLMGCAHGPFEQAVQKEAERRASDGPPATAPVPMLLTCPNRRCGKRHIDRGEFATKAHHTHACQFCGHVWRPALGATVGVQFLPGFKDADRMTERSRLEARVADLLVVVRPFAEFYKGIAASRVGRASPEEEAKAETVLACTCGNPFGVQHDDACELVRGR